MVAHWRPWRNLQFIDYSTGAVTNEVEADPLNPHYLTSAQYLGKVDCRSSCKINFWVCIAIILLPSAAGVMKFGVLFAYVDMAAN